MMTPLRFESLYENEWVELEGMLDRLRGRRTLATLNIADVSGARLATLYRRACEQLALARARAYPAYLTDRLEHTLVRGGVAKQLEECLLQEMRIDLKSFPAEPTLPLYFYRQLRLFEPQLGPHIFEKLRREVTHGVGLDSGQ